MHSALNFNRNTEWDKATDVCNEYNLIHLDQFPCRTICSDTYRTLYRLNNNE